MLSFFFLQGNYEEMMRRYKQLLTYIKVGIFVFKSSWFSTSKYSLYNNLYHFVRLLLLVYNWFVKVKPIKQTLLLSVKNVYLIKWGGLILPFICDTEWKYFKKGYHFRWKHKRTMSMNLMMTVFTTAINNRSLFWDTTVINISENPQDSNNIPVFLFLYFRVQWLGTIQKSPSIVS